jgi:membrane-associated phospholipid phosphatase
VILLHGREAHIAGKLEAVFRTIPFLLALALLPAYSIAQTATPLAPAEVHADASRFWRGIHFDRPEHGKKHSPLDILGDQKQIWTSPFRVRKSDAKWLLPLAAISGGLIASDNRSMQLEHSLPGDITRSNHVSDAGVAALGAFAVGTYAIAALKDNGHGKEAGFLTGEAMLNSLIVGEVLKGITQRQRPDHGNGHGDFFSAGSPNSSFPSEHAMLAWSGAYVMAHEYPGWLTKASIYGLATAVSISRVTAREHFPSDVVIGSALGYLVGRQTYRAHHDPQLPGDDIGTFVSSQPDTGELPFDMASPYVPLDSWVYPALERLAAMGYIDAQFRGLRPWTRLECARQTFEAESYAGALLDGRNTDSETLIKALRAEFAGEEQRRSRIELESAYVRVTGISGPPLADSYHFGQTIVNDFGRPYAEGANTYDGVSARAVSGRFGLYFRGEFQHADAAPQYSAGVQSLLKTVDVLPFLPPTGQGQIDRLRLLDTYASAQAGGLQWSFGKQSLWWAPNASTALLYSNNAEPPYMFRVSRTTPLPLPGFLSSVSVRGEMFIGKLTGHYFPARPFIHGEKVSFQFTRNLEMGFSRTVLFGGVGHPLTLHSFGRSFFSFSSPDPGNPGNDPGDRRSGFDFSYRVPFLRNWLTLYSDSLADDDPSPLDAPRRGAWSPGIYLSHLPGIPHMDVRVEAPYTDAPPSRGDGEFIYFNDVYRDGYTNGRELIGSWVGRQAKAIRAQSTYWFSATTKLQAGFRQNKLGQKFIPGGGTLTDVSLKGETRIRDNWSISAEVQGERWLIPALDSRAQRNVSTSIEVVFRPRGRDKTK